MNTTSLETPALPAARTMLRAFREKDAAYDGVFYVAVKTTGVFCRPVCRAKPPNAENVEFFGTARDALRNGYRACKLCRPLDPGGATPKLVTELISLVERQPGQRFGEAELSQRGIDPTTARRQFLRYCGMTFSAYQRAARVGAGLREIRGGRSVTAAQVNAGFASGSGFRSAAARLFGAAPANNGSTTILTARWIATPLGRMLAVAHDRGLLLLEFADRRALASELLHIRKTLGTRGHAAVIAPAEHPHLLAIEKQLAEYFDGTRREFSVPLDPRGTAFQQRAWRFLRRIPYAETRNYRDEANAIGDTNAVRAVGRANGANPLCIIVPCHRVIAADGTLCGYGGGLARKRWLLNHERKHAEASSRSEAPPGIGVEMRWIRGGASEARYPRRGVTC